MAIDPLNEASFRVQRIAAPLRHSVTDSIRNALTVGRFKAGQRLPERDLCEMTGVSRTLVREALRQLESEGLIEVIPHRGPIVARISPEQAEGIYQVRVELEGLACQLFAEKATEGQRAALVQAFGRVKEAFTDGDPITRLDAKNAFYACLIDGAGNEALGMTLRLLNSRVTVLRATSMQAPGRTKESVAELSELLERLLAQDGPGAREAAARHVRKAAAAAIALLRQELRAAE